MSKQMLSESEWSRNVGTQAFPVSFLHEYAVGLLWDKLHGRDPVVVTTMEGTESSDLRQGVDRVVIPDSMQPIGGCIPDLALLDKDLRPVRIIEVIVTSPPTDEKTEKLERLKERGVEVVLVPVRNEEELKTLVHERANGEGANWGPCIAAQGRQGRRVLIHPQEALLQQARALPQSAAYDEYRARRVVAEHQLVQLGIRQSRYFGRVKTKFQLYLAATVANLTLVLGNIGLSGSTGGGAVGHSVVLNVIRAVVANAAANCSAARLGQLWSLIWFVSALPPKSFYPIRAFRPGF